MKKRKICFLDFDGTLTKKDTFVDFGIFALGKAKFIKTLLRSLPNIFAWKLGFISGSNAKEKIFSKLFKGMTYTKFSEMGVAYNERINSILRLDIFECMKKFQEDGAETVVVSASIKEWIYPWAIENGVSKIIATEIETDKNGFLTGRFKTLNCKGEEKVKRIKLKFPELAQFESWAYGDSDSDKYMLSIVEHPVKV